MDLPKLLEIGKELNLQGQYLIAFICQREEAERRLKTEEANVARQERLPEREAKKEEAERESKREEAERESKREEAEQEAKREELRHEREMLTLRIESNRARAEADESPHTVMESTRDARFSFVLRHYLAFAKVKDASMFTYNDLSVMLRTKVSKGSKMFMSSQAARL